MNELQIEMVLARMRVELFTAAQLLKGEQLEEFTRLIREVNEVLAAKGATQW